MRQNSSAETTWSPPDSGMTSRTAPKIRWLCRSRRHLLERSLQRLRCGLTICTNGGNQGSEDRRNEEHQNTNLRRSVSTGLWMISFFSQEGVKKRFAGWLLAAPSRFDRNEYRIYFRQ